jgi:hypothetical protein
VEARFGGGADWFPGTVRSFSNGAYAVDYADGDHEPAVAEALIRAAGVGRAVGGAVGRAVGAQGAAPGAAPPSSQPLSKKELVFGRFKGGPDWFLASVEARRGTTCDLVYHDGDREVGVRAELLRGAPKVGDKIEARFGKGDAWFPGAIAAVTP